MSIETKLLTTERIGTQMKIITDELYEMMWELNPTREALTAIKEKMNRMVDKAWDDYRENLLPAVHPKPQPQQYEAPV